MDLSPPLLQSGSRPGGVESPSGLSPLLPAPCSLASFSTTFRQADPQQNGLSGKVVDRDALSNTENTTLNFHGRYIGKRHSLPRTSQLYF